MSDIVIEGKNLNDINQSNFQSVGPYIESGSIAVYEPWQGREIQELLGGLQQRDIDDRFSLGTVTENNRDFWEVQTTDLTTRRSQFTNKRLRTARGFVNDNGLVISDETDWSVDTFPYSVDDEGNSTPLYFYYDEKIHPAEYNKASNSKVNLKIELRESGRDGLGIIDNFLVREPFRPFVIGLNPSSYDPETVPGGFLSGDGAFNFGDRIEVLAEPFSNTHFVRWTEVETNDEVSTDNPYVFTVPRSDVQLIGNFNSNPIIKISAKVNGVESTDVVTHRLGVPAVGLTIDSFQTAVAYNDGVNPPSYDSPIFTGPDEPDAPSGFAVGTLHGKDGVFIVENVNTAAMNIQGTLTGYKHTLTWGFNPDVDPTVGEYEDYDYYNDEQNPIQNFRPLDELKINSVAAGEEYLFENYTVINQNGAEEDVAFSEIDMGIYEIPNKLSIESNPFPNNIIQFYANYTILLYYIRSLNNWFLSENSNQSLFNKQSFILTFGYGDGGPNFRGNQLANSENITVDGDGIDWFSMPVESFLSMRIPNLLDNTLPGYDIGEWFWWQNPVSGSSFSHFTIENDKQEFDNNILDSLTDDEVGLDDGVTLRISANNNMMSDVGTQITGTADAFTYIGYKFTQLGTYVKITKTDDSHDFNIVRPAGSYIIRNKENSPELDANMYSIGSTLNWTFTPNMVHQQGEVGEMPVIQSIIGWNESTKTFQTFPNDEVPSILAVLQTFGITYEQDGESMRLRYPLPDSNEDDLYLKYFEFIVKSNIVTPPLAPFFGVFEVEFNTNNTNLGTISFLQDGDETPQTQIIGLYGLDAGEFGVESPTYAFNMDEWHDGATADVLPIPLDVDINEDSTILDSLVAVKSQNFLSILNTIIEGYSSIPTNTLSDDEKQEIRDSLTGDYLDLSITDNNAFSIAQPPQNQLIRNLLNYVQNNNAVPRLPIRVAASFIQRFNISISSVSYMGLDQQYPTRFITNWNQAAYEADSSPTAADTWTDDSLMDINESFMFTVGDTINITIPAVFFNGSRQLKIRQTISPSSGASAGPDVFQSGGSATIYSDETSTFDWINRIPNVQSSLNITLNWVGGF